MYALGVFEPMPVISEVSEKRMAWLEKLVRYLNERWPEVKAQLLVKRFTSFDTCIVLTAHDGIEDHVKWWKEIFQDDGFKQLFEESRKTEKEVGTPFFSKYEKTLYAVVDTSE